MSPRGPPTSESAGSRLNQAPSSSGGDKNYATWNTEGPKSDNDKMMTQRMETFNSAKLVSGFIVPNDTYDSQGPIGQMDK